MINWRLIAETLAMAARGDIRISGDMIRKQVETHFHMHIDRHHSSANINDSYVAVFNFIMTLGHRKGLTDKEKIQRLLEFSQLLHVSPEYMTELIKDAGYAQHQVYNTPDLQPFNIRNYHSEIVTHCKKLFEQGHYLNAMNEACKAYNLAVKKKLGGTTKDGTSLMLGEFGQDKRIRAVPGNTDSEKNFLEGIKYLSAGLMHGVRNPTSHETVQTWVVDEQDCLDILSLASYLFRQLDKATVQP